MRGRLGKRGLLVLPIFLITAVFVLAGSATAEMSNAYEPSEEQALLEIYLPNKAAIDVLIAADVDLAEYVKNLDDGSVQVQAWLNDAERAELEAQGYQIGQTIQDYTTYLARINEREAAMAAEAASHEAAEDGAVAGLAAAKQRAGLRSVAYAQMSVLPELTINRVDYFQNYAGWFLSVEAFDQLVPPSGAPGSSGPVVSVSWKTPGGTYSNAVTMSRYIDPDPTPDSYLYNRILIRIGNASPPYGPNSPPVAPDMVRVGSTTGFSAEAAVRPWLSNTLPPHAAGYQSDFHTSYMDPTQVRDRFEALATEFPNISQLISAPFDSAGYQRKSAGTLSPNATTINQAAAAGASGIRVASQTGLAAGMRIAINTLGNQEIRTIATVITPNPASPAVNVMLTSPLSLAHASGTAVFSGDLNIGNSPAGSATPGAVVLTATRFGQNGGNQTRAQFVAPSAADSPLSVAVTPNILGQKDVVVTLATNSAGNVSSTAAQVVAAINADPAATAELSAQTWAGGTGAGIVQPRSLVALSDFLNAPSHVQRGPFRSKILRIGKDRSGEKTGVFIFCQQHAREWVTPITCLETAEELLRNYATDPETKELVDNLDIFIFPSVNPDGSHHSLYDFQSQRRNMTNYCAPTSTSSMPSGRNSWGVDLNRNSGEYSLFDGYFGASTSCTSDVYAGPAEYSEPETKNLSWVMDTFPKIKFVNNIHTSGGYFMWAPGSYTGAGRVTAPAPNIGVEAYFFAAADTVLQRIKDVRGTVVLPDRTGPIADVLYSAAGNGADDAWYKYGAIAYSFEAGSDRFTGNSTTTMTVASLVGATGIRVGSTTGFTVGGTLTIGNGATEEVRTIAALPTGTTSPAPNVMLAGDPLAFDHAAGTPILVPGLGGLGQNGVGFFPTYATEGKFEANEFAQGNFGLLESALAYQRDHDPPVAKTRPAPMASQTPIDVTFEWVNEPSVIYYTLDGTAPDFSSPKWERTGIRQHGESFTLTHTSTIRWFAVDIAGNSSTGSATFAIETDAPTTTATLSPPPQNGYYRNPFVSLVADDDIAGGGSGIASTEYMLDGAATWSAYSGAFQVTGDGPHTLAFRSTDNAGNVEATQTIAFDVDGTGPVISIATPPTGASYLLNQVVNAAFSCSDALSGVASCSGTVANGSAIPTNTVGNKTFSVSSSDLAGNTNSASRGYNVRWPNSGFLKKPLNQSAPGKYVKFEGGDHMNVVFELGGFRGMDILADGSPSSVRVSCASYHPRAIKKKLKRLRTKRNSGEDFSALKYASGSEEYSFKWITDSDWAGTCRMLVVTLADDTVHTAVVKFTR